MSGLGTRESVARALAVVSSCHHNIDEPDEALYRDAAGIAGETYEELLCVLVALASVAVVLMEAGSPNGDPMAVVQQLGMNLDSLEE